MECSDNIGLKDSRERGKRGCLYTLLVIMGLLLVFVGYVVYYNVHYEEIMDKRGLELVAKIDAFKKENGRLPENLGELGLKQWSDWGGVQVQRRCFLLRAEERQYIYIGIFVRL